jgi:hypothetical protein
VQNEFDAEGILVKFLIYQEFKQMVILDVDCENSGYLIEKVCIALSLVSNIDYLVIALVSPKSIHLY